MLKFKSFRAETNLITSLNAIAKERGLNLSALIRMILLEWLKGHKK